MTATYTKTDVLVAWTALKKGSSTTTTQAIRTVLDAVAPAIVARAKAEALREAADDMRLGWGDIVRLGYYGAIQMADDNNPASRVPLKDWLHDRADEIERGQ